MVLDMNKDTLLILNFNILNILEIQENINRLGNDFQNIVAITNLDNLMLENATMINKNEFFSQINVHLKKNNYIIFVDNAENVNIEDINNALNEAKNNIDAVIELSNKFGKLKDVIIKCFNSLFNTDFKSNSSVIRVFPVEMFKTLVNSQKSTNCLIDIVNNVPIKDLDIKKVKIKGRVGNDNVLNYLKSMFPYLLKGLIPYVIGFLIFLIVFYLRNSNNDLEGIILANIVGEAVGIVLHIIINYKDIYYHNSISKNMIYLLKKAFRIILASFFIYISYNILALSLIGSKLIIDFIVMILIAIFFNNMVKKD